MLSVNCPPRLRAPSVARPAETNRHDGTRRPHAGLPEHPCLLRPTRSHPALSPCAPRPLLLPPFRTFPYHCPFCSLCRSVGFAWAHAPAQSVSGSKKPTPLPPPQVNVLSLLYNTLLEGSVYTRYHHIFNPTCSSAHSTLSSALAPALVSPPQARQGPLTPTTCFSVLSSPRSPVAPDKAYTSCLLKVPSPPIPEHHSPAVPTTGRGTRCSRQSLRGAQGFGGTGGG